MIGASDTWLPALPPFLLASAVCIAAVPLTALLARRLGAVAEPDTERHLHAQPTPRLGGLALFTSFAVAVAVFGASVNYRWQIVAVSGAVTVAMALDDIFDLHWRAKLLIEVGAGVLVAALGITITFIAVPSAHGPTAIELGLFAAPLTVAWVVGMQVSVNLLDGADGVAAGVIAIVATVCLLAAVNRVVSANDVQSGVIVLCGALMGCCIGFLFYNLPPARVFMGDSGSHFLGVALAAVTVLGVAKVVVGLSLLVPLIALAIPIGDTAFAIVRRRRAGRSFAEPDAGHLHHRLLARGLSPMQTTLTFYLATAILGCIALSIYGHQRILLISLGLLVLSLAALLWQNRRARAKSVVADEESYLVVSGHPQLRPRIHQHGGETD